MVYHWSLKQSVDQVDRIILFWLMIWRTPVSFHVSMAEQLGCRI